MIVDNNLDLTYIAPTTFAWLWFQIERSEIGYKKCE